MERTYKITKFVSKINHLLNLPWCEGNKLISASKLIDANEGGCASKIGSDIWNETSKFFPQSQRFLIK
jgi:hypothetical protein